MKNVTLHVNGFTQNEYESGIHTYENIVKIITINSIFVHVNCINGSIVAGSKKPVIYTFFPTSEPGRKIVERPINPIYLPVSNNNIRDLYVKITDQDGELIQLRGETITIRFHIREK